MASDAIIGGLVLFFQLNVALAVFLLLIPQARRSVNWFRRSRDLGARFADKHPPEVPSTGIVAKVRHLVSRLYLIELVRMFPYALGLLYLVGTLVWILTGFTYSPFLAIWWIVVLATGMAQIDVAVLWVVFFAILTVLMGYTVLVERQLKQQDNNSGTGDSA